MRSTSRSRDSASSNTPTSATKRPRTSGGLTKDDYVDKVMTFDSDTKKDGEIPILKSVIKSEQSDEASKHTVETTVIVGNEDANFPFEKKKTLLWSTLESMEGFQKFPQKPHFRSLEQLNESFREGQAIGCMVNFCSVVERSSRLKFLNEPKSSTNELLENLFKLEENGFSVEIVRKHIAMREEMEKLQEQFEEVKGEIFKHITEKAEIEAMKEAKDQQIASLKLKKIVIEEDIAGVERDFQTSAASLGLTGNNCVVEGSVKPSSGESDGRLPMKAGKEVRKSKGGRPRSVKPGSGESDGQLPMKAGKEVRKSKGGRPRKLDGFVLPCNVPEKRKRSSVLDSGAEYSIPKSHKRTEQEKDVWEELIGSRVKVWWPDDQQYYEGIIESYDPAKKKHKVAYFDGDVENLVLKREQWLLVDEPSDCQQAVHLTAAGALWNLALSPDNARRIVEEGGVQALAGLCSTSLSKMACFMAAMTLAFMFDGRMDRVASAGAFDLDGPRKFALKQLEAFMLTCADQKALSAASMSSTSTTLTPVTEAARIHEAGEIKCSEEDIRQLVTMLQNPSSVLKGCSAFALLQVTVPGGKYAQHNSGLLQSAGAPRFLRRTAAAAITSLQSKIFARIVLRNLEHHQTDT